MTKKHPKIAFLYPGQGAVPEEPGGNYDETPEIGALYDSLAIPRYRPFENFHQKAEIDDVGAQLGVYFLSVALGQHLRDIGIEPDLITGYSSGLYAAMAGAECISPDQGPQIIEMAFEAIVKHQPDSAYMMVAVIGLNLQDIDKILTEIPGDGWLSLVNNRTQVIVSIPAELYQTFDRVCMAQGALQVVKLPFERAYHVPPLETAGGKLNDYLTSLSVSSPTTPMLIGSSPALLNDADPICRAVADQLWQPVNWHLTVAELKNQGAEILVSLDPTDTLTRIIRWLDRKITVFGISSSAEIKRLADHLR